jgi:hypothetical protein
LFEAEIEGLGVEPVKLLDVGDKVIASVRISGRGKSSGAPVELTLFSVSTFRNGLAYRMRNYATMSEALEAAGLSQ